jgi:uncharacterized protein YacL (UPF0231 family)
MKTELVQKYTVDAEGNAVKLSEEHVNVTTPTIEEEIANKEAKLLEMYTELQALKEKQTN